MGPVRPTYSSEECVVTHDSMQIRIRDLERQVSDHRQRFETLETHWWKRVWFWLQGWPWYPLNGERGTRPWRR